MILYPCRLIFHETLFYETRTLGRLYETGRLLHNIALAYALGFAQTSYFHATDVPNYAEELSVLNAAGIYITPAAAENLSYTVSTFKLGGERTSMFMERSNANIPTYGRAKEIAVNSTFSFGVLSETALRFPRWVRMGLWMSKARLEVGEAIPLRRINERREETVRLYPLNPNDLPASATLHVFDLVSMRPTSLVENAAIEAVDWWAGDHPHSGVFLLPAGIQYRVESKR